jgi:plasmid maintenance system killer protein
LAAFSISAVARTRCTARCDRQPTACQRDRGANAQLCAGSRHRSSHPRAPPANRLEQLKGDRAGQWSLRVNDRFRICFRWTGSDTEDVEIVDYHCGRTR